MKIIEIIRKSAKEQIRNFWILLLTVVMAPFFVGVYYLINESSSPSYDVLILNLDKGADGKNFGRELIQFSGEEVNKSIDVPLKVSEITSQDSAINLLRKKKADAFIILPEGFSDSLVRGLAENRPVPPQIEFMGNMTDFNYMIAAIWGSELARIYIESISGFPSPFILKETGLSEFAGLTEFDLYMPGMLILSIIMLMFTASIAFVSEIENGTILRFRLSGLSTFEFAGGVTFVQFVIGFFSVLITLWMAKLLGFRPNGSIWLAVLIVSLASLSMIGFSLILGAVSKSSNEILVIGNFPLFLFMFFTGAAFPMEAKAIFTIGGYGINLQGLMSPTHAVLAMKKVMLMGSSFTEVLPEIVCLVILMVIYFGVGIWLFNRRYMGRGV